MRLILLSLLALLGAGCSISNVKVDALPKVTFAKDRPLKVSYETILDRLGPPADIQAIPKGFAFLYQSSRFHESNLTLTYRYAKGAYSSGDRSIRRLVLLFNDAGLMTAWSFEDNDSDSGWGGIVGHSGSEELFFGQRLYDLPNSDHSWYSALLASSTKALDARPARRNRDFQNQRQAALPDE